MLAQIILSNYALGEISVPTKYFDDASSINLRRSVIYGLGVLRVSITGFVWRLGFRSNGLFEPKKPR